MTALFTALMARRGRALPLRRDPAAVRGRRSPGPRRPALRALRDLPAAQGRRLLPRPVRPHHGLRRPGHRDDLHPRPRRAALEDDPDVHRADLRGAVLRQHRAAHVAAARRRPRAARGLRGPARWVWPGAHAALPGQARRAGQGGAVHRQEHPGHPDGVRARGHRGEQLRRQHHPARRPSSTPMRPPSPASGCSTRSSSRAPSTSCSRCAATTACPACSTSTATRSTARSATWWSPRASCTSPGCPTRRRTGPTSTPSTPTATA